MFCPNCAAQNDESKHFCRMCGLHLNAIVAELTAQKPPPEMAALVKRRMQAQVLGAFSLSMAGIIGLSLVVAKAVYYKLLIFGPEVLFGSAIGAVILFLLASIFFFSYPKLFMKLGRINQPVSDQGEERTPMNKLLNDPPFQPASVTEHSTELLRPKSKERLAHDITARDRL